VAEFINTNQHVDMNLHWRTADGSDAHVGQSTAAADLASTYHVYAMDWEPDSVTWYVDGVQRFQVTKPSMVPQVAMELVLDLAVGFQEDPPASVDSAQLHVAWVGVWQH
jgi:beta-glucanase (GH16 family)